MVLDVAKGKFLSVGYQETSLDEIARDAGVAKKTLYCHFGNKAGLFSAILQALRQSWAAELRDVIIDSDEPVAVLEAAAFHLLEVGTRAEMVELHRLILVESRRFPELICKHYDPRCGIAGMEPLADYLRLAAKNGKLELDDVAFATEQFVYLVLGGIRARMLSGVSVRPDMDSRRRMAKQAARLFFAGCRQ